MDYICVRNLTLSNESAFHEQLSLFLRENVAKAGISNSFKGFLYWDMYMCQAYDAMELGREIHAHFWHYNFKDYAFAAMLKESTKKYPAKELISPTLNTLCQYDKKHKTDLYHTLDVYLRQNCSATHTAKELYIQRSSVLKRLEKIKRLTHINLSMYEEKIYIILNYSR
ncbi:helix-turn-helix domain-containing protein [Novisyntrophococcus fermenticellae]|uniref:PucR family transcriptional regulator n=1 Tax=Novisyntrophococcus fermenticellae TaxID=2068655 RepID=UPI001E3D9DDF|nr:helix-turn-helix domain-containing protein [Novisyntrophococcus fermenticellae]